MAGKMVDVETALDTILQALPLPQTETVPLLLAYQRVLAETVSAPQALPAWDASAMDGFAVRADEAMSASTDQPVVLPIAGEIAAGATQPITLLSGTAIRVMTGAPLPEGADAVVQVEETREEDEQVLLSRPAKRWQNVRRRGEDVALGDVLAQAGATLDPATLALLASAGRDQVPVRRRPRVAVVTTGDELVDPNVEPLWGQIHDANQYSLSAQIAHAGCDVVALERVRDEVALLEETLRRLSSHVDLLILSGGVSVGAYDVVKQVIANLGEVKLWQVAVKPGKPLVFGAIGDVPVFGLPGNPVSSMVAFDIFVRPAIGRMGGRNLPWHRLLVPSPQPLRHKAGRREFVRANVWWDERGLPQATVTGAQGSARLASMAQANSYLVIPEDQGDVDTGEPLELWLFPTH